MLPLRCSASPQSQLWSQIQPLTYHISSSTKLSLSIQFKCISYKPLPDNPPPPQNQGPLLPVSPSLDSAHTSVLASLITVVFSYLAVSYLRARIFLLCFWWMQGFISILSFKVMNCFATHRSSNITVSPTCSAVSNQLPPIPSPCPWGPSLPSIQSIHAPKHPSFHFLNHHPNPSISFPFNLSGSFFPPSIQYTATKLSISLHYYGFCLFCSKTFDKPYCL